MYKRKVEKERPMLTAVPRLISVDGIEGVGKTTIVQILTNLLEEKFGKENVLSVKVTNLKGSSKQEKLSNVIGTRKLSENTINTLWLAGTNRAYEQRIVPAIETGKIIILDRSELDLLRFAIESGDPALIEERKKNIADGSITHRYWAGNRVLLNGEVPDIYKNLEKRNSLVSTGLLTEAAVAKRLEAEKKAEKMILDMEYSGEQVVIQEKNKRVEDLTERKRYLEELTKKIFDRIKV
jgi:hypothetical protein